MPSSRDKLLWPTKRQKLTWDKFVGNADPVVSLCTQSLKRRPQMHNDEAKGVGKQAVGAIKDAVGGLTGNEKLQAEGKLDKAEGKVQQKVGEVKDGARDALKH